jgi:hypothetical protein
LVVLETPSTSLVLGEGEPRTVVLVLRGHDGKLQKIAQNSKIVPCKNCGGISGDPYGLIKIEAGQFSIITGGGSRWRWGDVYTFKYNLLKNDWLLSKVERSIADTETEALKERVLTPKNFGAVSFKNFNPSKLPKVRLP